MIGLRLIRKQRKLNQQKVAKDLHISRESLSYYENGKREPSLSLLLEMSNYFNVSINFLITGDEFKKNKPSNNCRKVYFLISKFRRKMFPVSVFVR